MGRQCRKGCMFFLKVGSTMEDTCDMYIKVFVSSLAIFCCTFSASRDYWKPLQRISIKTKRDKKGKLCQGAWYAASPLSHGLAFQQWFIWKICLFQHPGSTASAVASFHRPPFSCCATAEQSAHVTIGYSPVLKIWSRFADFLLCHLHLTYHECSNHYMKWVWYPYFSESQCFPNL